MLSWLSEGFHYRAMRAAQAADAAGADGRADHVQRYTAYAGQVFEVLLPSPRTRRRPEPALVTGEQRYGKGGSQKTSDYLDRSRDAAKCKPFEDQRVLPLQALDAGEYERLLALAFHGSPLGELLARKASGPLPPPRSRRLAQ